jgi:hypothetical protein
MIKGQMINNRHARRSAARTVPSAARGLRRTSHSRLLVIVFALVALTIQMLAVQSHIHRSPAAEQLLSDSGIAHLPNNGRDSSPAAQHHKYPDNQDPAKCPFCQQLGHSGQFIASSVILVAFRCCVTIVAVAFSESTRALNAVRHSWQSRAPPQE